MGYESAETSHQRAEVLKTFWFLSSHQFVSLGIRKGGSCACHPLKNTNFSSMPRDMTSLRLIQSRDRVSYRHHLSTIITFCLQLHHPSYSSSTFTFTIIALHSIDQPTVVHRFITFQQYHQYIRVRVCTIYV
ncbi:hypothetical protein DFA_05406 [Cavenderia fasciculata]|uniref:Uncharacterized protein n=1 Tax=Cavenderia fasciculata TaxID=261658 RepID=F4PL52_CACFS|nr:uncharacterized protein DFA_05406 [Cavenderia fasciculata]EGG23274.1 hypothetical protein DFA_05406 [Cavenderia fasciculata]|eukprot:XP_004361125.1 hypothetical protein DFA_05406 [Cavenderia fasciculata]